MKALDNIFSSFSAVVSPRGLVRTANVVDVIGCLQDNFCFYWIMPRLNFIFSSWFVAPDT